MPDPPVSSLLMYTPEDIDFDALSDDTLRALALEIDPFIATSALAELTTRGPGAARDVAARLLEETRDPWLRSTAFEILLDEESERAMLWAGGHARELDDEDLGRIAKVLALSEGWSELPGGAETRAELERRLEPASEELDRRAVEEALAAGSKR